MREEHRKSLELLRLLREAMRDVSIDQRNAIAKIMGFGTETWLQIGPFDLSVHTLNVSHDQVAKWFHDLEEMVENYEQLNRPRVERV